MQKVRYLDFRHAGERPALPTAVFHEQRAPIAIEPGDGRDEG